jgi:hypothetical protein
MQLKVDIKNTNLVNRSVPAAMTFVVRVDQYLLAEIEQELVHRSRERSTRKHSTVNYKLASTDVALVVKL